MMRTTTLLLILALCINGCRTAPDSGSNQRIIEVKAENLEGLDAATWSEVKVIDGRKVREVTGTGTALFTVPAWWGKAARPKQGEIFVVEIDYKDISGNPFIVSSFGNCANSLDSLSELHRALMLNTQTWKTAMIPVSYDYLYVGDGGPAENGRQLFSIKLTNGDKSLPVSAIRIRPSISGDEARYNSETRAWVKKVQEKYPATDKLSSAVLPDNLKAKSCIVYQRNYLTPVLPSDAPKLNEVGTPVRLRMSVNETECRQVAVYANGKNLEGVTISVGDLKNEKGESFEGEKKQFTVEYAMTKGRRDSHKTDAQRIWPMYETPVQSGHSQSFWLTFKTISGSAKPGTYKGYIDVQVKNGQAEKIPLEIEVTPVTLLTMNQAGLSMGGCVLGLLPFHDLVYSQENNVNAINLWFNSVRPEMSKENGKLKLDFTLMDEWMKEARRLGLQNIVYFLGGNPYGFPKTMSIERDLFITMQDSGTRQEKFDKFLKLAADPANRNQVMKDIRDVYAQWVKEVTEHARDNQWPELILTPFDEPAKHEQKPYRKEGYLNDDQVIGTGPWIKTHFEDACDIIRNNAPKELRIYGSIHEASGIEFLPKVNVFCTNAVSEDTLLGVKVNAGGPDKHFWQYTGIGDGGASEPSKMRYSFGFYFGSYNSRGSLLWAYNWGARFNTTEGYNWMICWDTPFGVIPTLSYEGLREAWDDRRYIETLKKIAKEKGRENEINAFLRNIFYQATRSRMDGGNDRVDDFWSNTKDPAKMDEWRSSITDKIIELSKS